MLDSMLRRVVIVALILTMLGVPNALQAVAETSVDPKTPTLVATGPTSSNFFFVYQGKRQWLTIDCSSQLDANHTPTDLRWSDISDLQSAPATWTCTEIDNLLAGEAPPEYELVTNSINNSAGWIISPTTKQWLSTDCRAQLQAAGYPFAIAPFQSFGARMPASPAVACDAIPDMLTQAPQPPYPARCAEVTSIPQTECEALVAFYNSTGGPNWTHQGTWLQGDDPCTWRHFQPSPSGGIYRGPRCTDGHVFIIEMSEGNNLVGELPAEIGNLPSLVALIVAGNPQLSGPIPASIGNLDNIGEMYLNDNGLTGPLPAELGDMESLTFIELSNNNIDGTIPPEMANISAIAMLNNQLTGAIPRSFLTGNTQTLVLTGNCIDDTDPAILEWTETIRTYRPGTNCAITVG